MNYVEAAEIMFSGILMCMLLDSIISVKAVLSITHRISGRLWVIEIAGELQTDAVRFIVNGAKPDKLDY